MRKPATGRSDRLRAGQRDPAQQPRRAPVGDGFVLSADSKHMLRAIRDRIDDGVLRLTNDAAAALAGMSLEAAERALHELSRRGFVKLRRGPGSKALAAQGGAAASAVRDA